LVIVPTLVAAFATSVAFAASPIVKVRIGIENNSPPLAFADAEGRSTGFTVELLRAAGTASGVEYEVTASSWTYILQEFNAGRLDALANVAITPDRAATMNFSVPHAYLRSIAWIRPESPPIRSTSDFLGKRVALVEGSLSQMMAQQRGGWGARLQAYPSRSAALEAVRRGDSDIALVMRPSGITDAEKLDLRANLVDDCVGRFHVAVHQGDTARLDLINQGLAVVLRDGTFDRLYERWIGPIEPRPISLTDLRPYVWPAATVLLLIAGALAWQRRTIVLRTRGEALLRQNELKYRTLFETAEGAILLFAEGRWVDCNTGALKVFGCTREQIIGAHPSRFSPPTQPDGRPSDAEAIKLINLAFTGLPQHFEWEHCRLDGTPFAAEVSLNRLDLDGKPYMQAIVRDISKHKRAAEALAAEKRNLDALFESSPVALLVLDATTNIVRVNAAAVALTGGSETEFLQHRPGNALRCVHSSKDPRGCGYATECPLCSLRNGVEALIKSGGSLQGAELDLNLIRKGAPEKVSIKIGAEPVMISGVRHLLVAIDDITERKRAEGEAALRDALFRAVFDHAPVGISLAVFEGKLMLVNEAHARITGVPVAKSFEKGVFSRVTHPEDLARQNALAQKFISGESDQYTVEKRYLHPDGRVQWAELTSHFFPGQVAGEKWLVTTLIDIAARKEAEEKIQAYQHHLEEMVSQRTKEIELLSQLVFVSLEAATVGAWWVNFEEDDTYHALDTTAKMIGVPVSQLPNKAYRISEWVKILHRTQTLAPEYGRVVDEALEQFAGTISGKYEKYQVIYPVALPDKTVRWIEARANVSARDQDGKARVMTGTLIDVTKLMEVEQVLKAHQLHLETVVTQRTEELALRNRDLEKASERLDLATRAANVGIWDWDVVKNELVWDNAMYRLYGLRSGDFGGAYEAWAHTIHPDDKVRTEGEIQAALRGEHEYAPEFRVVWPDGSIHHLKASSLTFRSPDGKPIRMVGINFDITELKRAEAKLLYSTQLLERTAEMAKVGGWEMDLRTSEIVFSKEMARIHELEVADATEKLENLARYYPPEAWRTVHAAMQATIAHGKSFDLESPFITAKGRQLWVRVQGSIVMEDGKPINLRGTLQDITEKKQLEEKFLHAQRLEGIGMLAAGISHDLNNVLAPIMMAAPMLRPRLSNPRDSKMLDHIEQSVARGAGLVKQILGFVHTTVGEFQSIQVKHIARDIVSVITGTFPKSIQFKHAVSTNLWPVLGNATQIHQVLLNLCVNARDAMPLGGTLSLKVANQRLDAVEAAAIPGAQPGAWLMLEVGDTGMGIPPEIMEQIWTPFFTTKGVGKGTGLGLSTVRSIVASHHGFIALDTQVGRGSTFRVYLPAIESEVAPAKDATPGVVASGRNEMILVVDDNAVIRDTVIGIIEEHGYRAIGCVDGVEALEQFSAQRDAISLVITDVDMPRLGGVGLIQALQKLHPDTRILAMSGQSDSGDGIPQIQTLAHAFLLKPFKPEDLLNVIHRLLQPSNQT
jgi:PAS domain S-box-containing protein